MSPEIQRQQVDADLEPVEATPSTADNHQKPTAPVIPRPLMCVGDVAVRLNTSVTAVWRLKNNDPDFPQPIKIGGSTRWDPAEIDCYVDVCKARRPNGR
ncbi:MAG: hypothetical protein RIA09_10260 [Hoeflea sp.]|uniref:helix-turn-helix transcriptional regulator n=1 Tax=Hoeflea sp. TaxID=1940281 RepID=UPI0032EC7493